MDAAAHLEPRLALDARVEKLHGPVGELVAVVVVEDTRTTETAMLRQSIGQRLRHRDLTPSAALRDGLEPLAALSLPDRALHLDDASFEIEVRPLERHDL